MTNTSIPQNDYIDALTSVLRHEMIIHRTQEVIDRNQAQATLAEHASTLIITRVKFNLASCYYRPSETGKILRRGETKSEFWASTLGREVRNGVIWYYVQPDELNLPTWLKGSDIISFEVNPLASTAEMYTEFGKWLYGIDYVCQIPGAGAYEPGRGGTFKSWLQSEYGNTYGAGR